MIYENILFHDTSVIKILKFNFGIGGRYLEAFLEEYAEIWIYSKLLNKYLFLEKANNVKQECRYNLGVDILSRAYILYINTFLYSL